MMARKKVPLTNKTVIFTAGSLAILVVFSITVANTFAQQVVDTCDPPTYEKRAKELQQIAQVDQNARKTLPLPSSVILQDKKRRMRVGEIFGEGCFKSAADFSAAALVYQHGSTPDHFMQTFIWSKRAVELGDAAQKYMMAQAIDRYLVNTGKKQLFASQAFKLNNKDSCFCLQPVERSFPDSKRVEYIGQNLVDSLKWVDGLNKGSQCPPATECSMALNPTQAGSIPGFW